MDFNYTEHLPLLMDILGQAQKQFVKDRELTKKDPTKEEEAMIIEMHRVTDMAHSAANELARKAKKRK